MSKVLEQLGDYQYVMLLVITICVLWLVMQNDREGMNRRSVNLMDLLPSMSKNKRNYKEGMTFSPYTKYNTERNDIGSDSLVKLF